MSQAWGLSFEDHAELLGVDGTKYVGLASAEAATPFFTVGERVTPRLVWVQAAPAD